MGLGAYDNNNISRAEYQQAYRSPRRIGACSTHGAGNLVTTDVNALLD